MGSSRRAAGPSRAADVVSRNERDGAAVSLSRAAPRAAAQARREIVLVAPDVYADWPVLNASGGVVAHIRVPLHLHEQDDADAAEAAMRAESRRRPSTRLLFVVVAGSHADEIITSGYARRAGVDDIAVTSQ